MSMIQGPQGCFFVPKGYRNTIPSFTDSLRVKGCAQADILVYKNHRLGLKTLVNCSFRWLYFQLKSNFYILRRGIPLSNNWPQIPNLIDAGTLENRQKPAKIEGNPNCGSPATETATVHRFGCLYNSVRDYWTVKILGVCTC